MKSQQWLGSTHETPKYCKMYRSVNILLLFRNPCAYNRNKEASYSQKERGEVSFSCHQFYVEELPPKLCLSIFSDPLVSCYYNVLLFE